jgi:hypothetical protein
MSYSASNSQPSSPKLSASLSIHNNPNSTSSLPFTSNFINTTPTTPSQIIKEAREKLHESKRNNTSSGSLHRTSSFQHSKNSELSSSSSLVGNGGGGGGGSAGLVRTLNSTRPFTPRDEKRSLFGPKSTRHINERPSSSYGQIGSKSFDQTDVLASSINTSRPLSATRLSPIEKHITNTTNNPTTSNAANSKNNILTKQQQQQSSLTQNDVDSFLFISSSSQFQNANSNNNNNSSRINSSQSLRSNSGRLAPLDVTSLSTNKSIEKKKKITTTVTTKNGPTIVSNGGTSKTTANNSNTQHSQQEQIQEDVNLQANWLIHIQPLLNSMETYFKGIIAS